MVVRTWLTKRGLMIEAMSDSTGAGVAARGEIAVRRVVSGLWEGLVEAAGLGGVRRREMGEYHGAGQL